MEAEAKPLILFGGIPWSNSHFTVGPFTYRFGVQVGALRQCKMNNPSFISAHRFERKRRTRLPNPICRQIRHCLKLGFAGRAETVHIADKSRSSRKVPAVNLIDYVL